MQQQHDNNAAPQDEALDGEFIAEMDLIPVEEPLLTPDESDRAAIRSDDLDSLLVKTFNGRIVRKDLTKQLKEGANVPVYVLEYLLGMYCSVADDELVEEGLKNVKKSWLTTMYAPMKQKRSNH